MGFRGVEARMPPFFNFPFFPFLPTFLKLVVLLTINT
jgi:hypothetical protein